MKLVNMRLVAALFSTAINVARPTDALADSDAGRDGTTLARTLPDGATPVRNQLVPVNHGIDTWADGATPLRVVPACKGGCANQARKKKAKKAPAAPRTPARKKKEMKRAVPVDPPALQTIVAPASGGVRGAAVAAYGKEGEGKDGEKVATHANHSINKRADGATTLRVVPACKGGCANQARKKKGKKAPAAPPTPARKKKEMKRAVPVDPPALQTIVTQASGGVRGAAVAAYGKEGGDGEKVATH